MSNFMSAALTVDDIYPVGSIYMSVNATDPARLFGGTWERIKEKFLLGAGDTHTAGSLNTSWLLMNFRAMHIINALAIKAELQKADICLLKSRPLCLAGLR